MVVPDGPEQDGINLERKSAEQSRPQSDTNENELSIPKNRSTGNLLSYGPRVPERGRIRFSFDGGLVPPELEALSRSPIMTDHEHGLGASGLRRIRQQPQSRVATNPSSEASSRNASVGPRAVSMTIKLPSNSRKSSSGALTPGLTSPTMNFTEDLTRFPSESLHSFSFAHQSDEFSHNRHNNVLKRSIEFMKDRLGWAASNPGLASAQARVSGDHEAQHILEILSKANLIGEGTGHRSLQNGPLTGPADMDGEGNVFDKSFLHRSSSPDTYLTPSASPTVAKKPFELPEVPEDRIPTPDVGLGLDVPINGPKSSSVLSNDGQTTKKSLPMNMRSTLKRTLTDTSHMTLQNKLLDAMSTPYVLKESAHSFGEPLTPSLSIPSLMNSSYIGHSNHLGPAVHGHTSRWAPAAQAVFTTEAVAPWTILAANDLACLVFGVTKAEVRKMGIMEVVREERRAWLVDKLAIPKTAAEQKTKSPPRSQSNHNSPNSTTSALLGRGGLTAQLLSKPPSRVATPITRKAQTDDGAGSSIAAAKKREAKGETKNESLGSRGVLLCGDVVPIQKRNGHTGSASLWVKEKRGGLIWVLEEIHEDIAILGLDNDGLITHMEGSTAQIWGADFCKDGVDISKLVPQISRSGVTPKSGDVDFTNVEKFKYFTAKHHNRTNIPACVEKLPGKREIRVSSFPHIAGILVLNAKSLHITSSNSVFSAALFGQDSPDGLSICDLIPNFNSMLRLLQEDDGVRLVDGIVIPEQSFRRARAFLALRQGKGDAAQFFLRPDGLPAKHRDGSEIKIDVQMRVVKSERQPSSYEHAIVEEDESINHEPQSEVVYALWITYSRHLHVSRDTIGTATPSNISGTQTPLHQPSPGQTQVVSPEEFDSDEPAKEATHASLLTTQLKNAATKTLAKLTGSEMKSTTETATEKIEAPVIIEPAHKKSMEDYNVIEDLGQGAYGQVKLARNKSSGAKVVIKYVTKKRILVDTWTRDRKLGTVPLEIHVLDFLKRDGMAHPGLVVMVDFWEDDMNYYIEMLPHGLPGMDLFDYIELRVNMTEVECRGIFTQVAQAVHHLHTKALVVHRDIKDENVVLDGDNQIKLIDFGSASYIKNGPFDVFVGTIDYAAPEVLAGKRYKGPQQDVWALGILLYTIIYKENPFYSIDEIMDHPLRVPYIMSEASIDLIRKMLDRDVEERIDITGVINHEFCQPVMVEDESE